MSVTTLAEHRWQGNRGASAFVRVVVFLVPIVAAVVAARAVSSLLPAPTTFGQAALMWLILVAVSTAVVLVVERVARRLLPLAFLLQLSLLFPGDAPSRYRVALRAGSTRALRLRLEEARRAGAAGDPIRSAELVLSLAAGLSAHDRRTRGHSERVRAYAELIAQEMGLDEADRERLRWAALLHDVGKIRVPAGVLNKVGEPDDEEWLALRAHPQEGASLAAPLMPWLGEWGAAIAHHHEHYDGTGYPMGLRGDEISLGGRIVAVADAFETMTSARSYKEALAAEDARAELASCAGTHFDPEVVRAFMNVAIARLRWIAGPLVWLLDLPLVQGVRWANATTATGSTLAVTAAALAMPVALAAPLAHGDAASALAMPRFDSAMPETDVAGIKVVNVERIDPYPGYEIPAAPAEEAPVALGPAPGRMVEVPDQAPTTTTPAPPAAVDVAPPVAAPPVDTPTEPVAVPSGGGGPDRDVTPSEPVDEPTEEPTVEPTEEPTEEPTGEEPAEEPIEEPTAAEDEHPGKGHAYGYGHEWCKGAGHHNHGDDDCGPWEGPTERT